MRVVRAALVAIAVLGALGVIGIAFLPPVTSIGHVVIDDAGYYLTLARHLVHGDGATLDGRNQTNGFHPLWAVMLVGSHLLGGSPDAELQRSLLLAAAAFIATGLVLIAAVRTDGAPWLAVPFAALFLFNYRLASIPLGGLESGVSGLLAVLVGVLTSRWAGTLSARRAAILGALIGLAALARMDALLLGAVAIAWLAFQSMRSRSTQQAALVAITGIVAALVLVPWFIFSWQTVHTLLPRSGEAIRVWSPSPWAGWSPSQLRSAVLLTIIGPAGHIANIIGIWPMVNRSGIVYTGGGLALTAWLAGIATLTWRLRDEPSVQRVNWIPIYALLHAAYYVRFLSHPRYLYPVVLLMSYVFSVEIAAAGRRSVRPDRWIVVVHACAIVMLVIGSIAGAQAYGAGIGTVFTHLPQQAIYADVAPWLAAHTPSDARVGAFNGGLLSHYSQRSIVDLDGVMNDNAIAPLKNGGLCDYIERERLEYLADMALAFDDFFGRDASCARMAWRSRWDVVHRTAWPPGPGGFEYVVLKKR